MADFKFEDSFFAWLSARVSPAQLSALYSAFTEINNYCLNKKLLTKPLFETDDIAVLMKIQSVIERNKLFAFTHRRQKNAMSAAIRHYCRFIEERKGKNNEEKATVYVMRQPEQLSLSIDSSPAEEKPKEAEASSERAVKAEVLPKEETPSELKAAASEIDELLKDELFLPLRAALAKENIRSIAEFKEIKLWAFMNKNNIYTIPVRQSVLTKVRLFLEPPAEENPELLYKLHCGSEVYTGETPSKAFLRFCEEIAGKYPLFFRSLLDYNIGTSSKITIFRNREKGEYLKMENPSCFISAKLKNEEVISAAEWIYEKCFKKKETVTIEEPETRGDEPLLSDKAEEEKTSEEVKDTVLNESPSGTSDEKEEYWLDIMSDRSLNGITPVSFSYKGTYRECSSWFELYVGLIKEFYFDKSPLFGSNVYINGSRRVDIGSIEGMTDPQEISEGVFAECHIKEDKIIEKTRWLMKYCSVGRDDIVIKFKYVNNNVKPASEYIDEAAERISENRSSGVNKKILTDTCEQQIDFNADTPLAYTKPVRFSYKGKTKSCTNWSDLYLKLVREIYSDKSFLFNGNIYFPGSKRVDIGSFEGMRKPMRIAKNIYLECGIKKTGNSSHVIDKIRWLLKYCSVSYDDVVIIYRTNGNKASNQNSVQPLQKENDHLTAAESADEQIVDTGEVTLDTYALERKADEIPQAVPEEEKESGDAFSAVEEEKETGEAFSAVNEHKEEAVEKADDIAVQEDKTDKTEAYEEELADRVKKFVLDSDLEGVTYDDIYKLLNTTYMTVKNLVSQIGCIVEMKGRLYHEEAFIDWDEGAKQLCGITEKLMKKNSGYVSAVQLYEYARSDMNMFLNDNDLNDERSVYEMAQHLFQKNSCGGYKYVFSGKTHISKAEAEIGSNFDIICKYAEDQGGLFSEEELLEYLNGLGIKTGSIRSQMKINTKPFFFFYDKGMIISEKSMAVDDLKKEGIKKALDKLFDDIGDHIIIRDIQPVWFEQLPALPGNISWTPLLLQSFLRFYGEEAGAKTIGAMDNQKADTLHTMLVKYDSPVQNFGDAVVSYIVENEIEKRSFEAEELRQLLAEAKMIQGSELMNNMPKALADDERFAWDAKGQNVTVRV
ncbi:MAG: hypothetical protein LUC92_04710 [Clostridiales bacterium]|nr:hypothetical protein [Clostridiales bacterium]